MVKRSIRNLLLVAALAGCGPSDVQGTAGINGSGPTGAEAPGGNTGGGDTDGAGGTPRNGGSTGTGTDGTTPITEPSGANACAVVNSQATLTKKPVDIIMVIDNSGSMTLEIEKVQENVNDSFAKIIGDSGLDYRVILISKHGTSNPGQSICIKAPLSGTDCGSPFPTKPVNGERFFQYDTEISSTNSLTELIRTYDTTDPNGFAQGGWKNWLRTGSSKTIIEITDDRPSVTADSFETSLFAKASAHFGTAAARNYVFHSIIGISENNPVNAAWAATDPLKGTKCSTADNAAPEYKKLSMRTGGLRFPICQTDNYDAVFRAAAQGVISGAKVECSFDAPAPPDGRSYDKVAIDYTPGDGSAVQRFKAVSTQGECTASSFYREGTTNRFTLCADACAKVQSDAAAKVALLFTCASDYQ